LRVENEGSDLKSACLLRLADRVVHPIVLTNCVLVLTTSIIVLTDSVLVLTTSIIVPTNSVILLTDLESARLLRLADRVVHPTRVVVWQKSSPPQTRQLILHYY